MDTTRITLLAAAGFAAGLVLQGSALAANCESLGKSASLDAYVRLHQDAQGINAVRNERLPAASQADKAHDVRAAVSAEPATVPFVVSTEQTNAARRAYASGRRLSGVLSY